MYQHDVLIRTSRVAALLAVNARTVRRWAEEGKIQARKIGGQWRFSKATVLALRPSADTGEPSDQI